MTFLLVHKQNYLFLTKKYFNSGLKNSVGIAVDVLQAAALLLLTLNKKRRLSSVKNRTGSQKGNQTPKLLVV